MVEQNIMANELPTNVNYGTIVGRFLIAYQDKDDADLYPDGAPASGYIYLVPSVEKVKDPTASPAPVTIIPTTLKLSIDSEGYIIGSNGNRGVAVIATDDTDLVPTGWTWGVRYELTDPSGTPLRSIGAHNISVPGGTTIDLITTAPVAGLVS